jgi:hypothetical protein
MFGEAAMNLTLEARDPSDELTLVWTNSTNSTGWSDFSFSLPKDAELGIYNCTIMSEKGEWSHFTFNVTKVARILKLFIISMELDGNYDSKGNVNATVVVENPADYEQTALLILQVINPKDEPLSPAIMTFTIGAENTSTFILNVNLPAKTRTGPYSVQVELFNDFPSNGGTLYEYRVGTFKVK